MTTVPPQAPLERAYGRLLKAYPRDYRRLRGAEILGVLVDGARPGQRYPRPREVVDLLAGGLRQRMGVNTTPGFTDGLRIALPIALALAAVLSANVRVGGLDTVPEIQPYAYVWAAALVAWVISPTAGRVVAVVAALVTIRLAAAWSYVFAPVFAVCLVGTIVAATAIIAPRIPASTDKREYGSALWSLPGRLATLLAAAALAGTGFVGLPGWNQWVLTAAQFAVVVLAMAGTVLAARRRGTGLLWAAGVLAPAAVVVPAEGWPYPFGWYWIGVKDGAYDPWLLLRLSLPNVADIVMPIVGATMVTTAFVAAVAGRAATQRAATTLTRSTLAGLAVVIGALELAGGVPSLAVAAGCAALIVTCVAAALLPRAVVVVVQVAAAVAVLSDIMSPVRYARPWPLFVLALLAVLALVQTLLESGKPPLWSTVVGTSAMAAVAAAVVYKATHYQGTVSPYAPYFSSIEHEPLFLAVPAFAAALVTATLLAGRMPARAAGNLAVALGGLLWLAAPIRNLALVAGVAVAGAMLGVLAGYLKVRFLRVATHA